jgi:hypothetical protein
MGFEEVGRLVPGRRLWNVIGRRPPLNCLIYLGLRVYSEVLQQDRTGSTHVNKRQSGEDVPNAQIRSSGCEPKDSPSRENGPPKNNFPVGLTFHLCNWTWVQARYTRTAVRGSLALVLEKKSGSKVSHVDKGPAKLPPAAR